MPLWIGLLSVSLSSYGPAWIFFVHHIKEQHKEQGINQREHNQRKQNLIGCNHY